MADNYQDLTIRVKDESSETFKQIGLSVEDLAKGISAVIEETKRLNSEISGSANMADIFDAAQQSMDQLMGACQSLSEAYQGQIVAETQLQTVMQQRMAATHEDIDSIKALCAAQQQLGVISDEVQMSGARQLAMFISQKTSLDILIPAMNNLLAQQNGLNATSQDAVNIGNLLGTAMQGQADALDAAGIALSDAQKETLQFGNESERAVILAQAISTSVGQMNAELAKTDAGQQKQLENTLAGLREEMGGLVQPMMTTLTIVSQLTTTIVGISTLAQSFSALAASTRVAALAQTAYSAVTTAAGRAIYVYQMQVLTARAAITTTTGATRLMNIAIAASPYMLAATAVAALAAGIYKLCTSSDMAHQAHKRLNDTMEEMNTEVARETITLDALFAPLSRAKEGSQEWQKAKEAIMAKYGTYLEKIGVEITSVDSARNAYNKLSQAILDTARARAMEKATGSAAESYAGVEGKALKNIHQSLYRGVGQGDGKITAEQADKAWQQIREAVRSGEDIPQEAADIMKQIYTVSYGMYGSHSTSPISGYIYAQIEDVRKANAVFKNEMEQAKAMFGDAREVLDENSPSTTPASPSSSSAPNTTTGKNSKTADQAKMSYDQLQAAIADTDAQLRKLAPTETEEIDRLNAQNKLLKTRRDTLAKIIGLTAGNSAAAGNSTATYAPDSLAALDDRLNKLKAEQRNAPEALQLTFTAQIVGLEKAIAEVNDRLAHEKFITRYTLKPTPEDKPAAGPLKDVMKSSLAENGPLADVKLPKFEVAEPLKGMAAWNAAVDAAREKHSGAIDSMNAMGSAMGSLGELIGGQAGAWLDWAGNLLGAIAQALPQLAALATANTATAATGAASSVASIPFVGPVLAVAAVASVLGALMNLPKLANGGIAYGPTLGIFGEYAGASSNPEVVAPLNRLKQLMQPARPEGLDGKVVFDIHGRTLRGILQRENNLSLRS